MSNLPYNLPNTIIPDIRIRSHCIFCDKRTDSVASYLYFDPLGLGYDRILIRFPAHPGCFLFRKLFRLIGLLIGGLNFFILGFLGTWYFSSPESVSPMPLWAWVAAAIAAIVSGGFFFFTIHRKTREDIHQYYVLNENLPEADKSWRRRSSRFKTT